MHIRTYLSFLRDNLKGFFRENHNQPITFFHTLTNTTMRYPCMCDKGMICYEFLFDFLFVAVVFPGGLVFYVFFLLCLFIIGTEEILNMWSTIPSSSTDMENMTRSMTTTIPTITLVQIPSSVSRSTESDS